MELFTLRAKIHMFDTFGSFAESFGLNEEDLILTERILWERYMESLKLNTHVILKDDYSQGEPDDETVDSILRDMSGLGIRRIIAVGGGSVIDIAKVICVRNAYPIADVMSHRTPAVCDKELIVLPSTCGTGSEVTFGGIILMKKTGLKTAIMDETLVSSHAVLIPELLRDLPFRIFMHCSIDALGHSMESYVSATRGNEFARAMGARAVKMLTEGYARLAVEGEEAKKDLLATFIQASCMGGMAVNNGGAGPVHALAYPLGERYHMSHGESIYEFLTEVFLHYEMTKGGDLLNELADLIRPSISEVGIKEDSVFKGLELMLNRIMPSRPLRECGMKEEDILPFTESIFEAKQRLLSASYSEFTREDAIRIYKARF